MMFSPYMLNFQCRVKNNIPNSSCITVSIVAELMTAEEMDDKLVEMEDGVEQALGRAKAWSAYCKHVLSFVNKRVQLELAQVGIVDSSVLN